MDIYRTEKNKIKPVGWSVFCVLPVLTGCLVGIGCSSCFDRAKPVESTGVKHAPHASDEEPSEIAPRKVRSPAVAGSWYPGEKDALAKYVDEVLDGAEAVEAPGQVMALISPHAGYRFSGKAAATGFKLLKGRDIRRVIVLAVAHRVPFAGASIAEVTHYETPLGLIPLDERAVARLRRSKVVKTVASAHEQEHSLEIQLPLLQRVLPKFSLVPILLSRMGDEDYKELAGVLAEIVDAHTLVVASSDFTHRGPNYSYEIPPGKGSIKQRLAKLDQGAIDRILRLDRADLLSYQKKTGTTICGLSPIGLLLELLSNDKGVKGQVLSHYTSGDVLDDWSNTVTYIEIAFFGSWPQRSSLEQARSAGEKHFPLTRKEKRVLLRLARATLDASVRKGEFDESVLGSLTVQSSLKRKAGAFVTLKCKRGAGGRCAGKGDDLRGCMGIIQPMLPVVESVAQRAATAALGDPRFPNVTADELRHITVEVSVLTPPREVASARDIVIGRHGIILAKNGHSATFLPQVAPEQGWDRDETLSHLSRKAGLGIDGWRDGASFSVYEAIVFAEGEAH